MICYIVSNNPRITPFELSSPAFESTPGLRSNFCDTILQRNRCIRIQQDR